MKELLPPMKETHTDVQAVEWRVLKSHPGDILMSKNTEDLPRKRHSILVLKRSRLYNWKFNVI